MMLPSPDPHPLPPFPSLHALYTFVLPTPDLLLIPRPARRLAIALPLESSLRPRLPTPSPSSSASSERLQPHVRLGLDMFQLLDKLVPLLLQFGAAGVDIADEGGREGGREEGRGKRERVSK